MKYLSLILIFFMSFPLISQDLKSVFLYPNKDFIGSSNQNTTNINNGVGREAQDIKRSVGIVDINNLKTVGTCSCNVINNITQDGKYYLLTAAHCIDNPVLGQPLGLYFSPDYEMSHASDRGVDDFSPISVAIRTVKLLSGKLVVLDIKSDIALIRLDNDNMNSIKNLFLAGWDFSLTKKNTLGFKNISHPKSDHKKAYISPIKATLDIDKFKAENANYYNAGLFYNVEGGWNNYNFDMDGGSSGSGLFDSNDLITSVFSGSSYPLALFSSISNSYISLDGSNSLSAFLDPNGTWLNKIPGGYMEDLIPVNEKFDLIIDQNSSVNSDTKYVSNKFIFSFKETDNIQDWDKILGIKSNSLGNSEVALKMVYLENNSADLESGQLNERLIYGSKINKDTPEDFNTANFKSGYWDCNITTTNDKLKCNRIAQSVDPYYWRWFESDQGLSTDYKEAYIKAVVAEANRNPNEIYNVLNNYIPVKIYLHNLGVSPVNIQAVSYPGDVPKNALELVNPEEVFSKFKYYKYKSSQLNSTNLSIDNIILKNWDKPHSDRDSSEPIINKSISTGNNGGYLNLVNPKYGFRPVQLSWKDPEDQSKNKDRYIELEIKLNKNITGSVSFSVWIDYFNRESILGKNISDNSYNFETDELQHHPSELLASSQNNDSNTIISYPDDNTISINAKLPLIGIGANNSQIGKKRLRISVKEGNLPPSQEELFSNNKGETEDYLIELVAPPGIPNLEEKLAEMQKQVAQIRHNNRKQTGDQNPNCEVGDETGDQMYDRTGLDNSPYQRTCSKWEGPCVAGGTCDDLFVQDAGAEGGVLVNFSGNNYVQVDRMGAYTIGNLEDGYMALTTYKSSDPYCEDCVSGYILKQGSIQGDNDGDGGGDGDGDGWGIRFNPDAQDPEIELEVDVNDQQQIISVPIKEWLAQDPNQKFDIMVKKKQKEVSLEVRSRSTNTYVHSEMLLQTSTMNITHKTTLGGGESQVYANTNGTIYDFMYNNTPTTDSEDDILFSNATEIMTSSKSSPTTSRGTNTEQVKEVEDQPDFSIYPNPAADKLNILVEVRQEGPLYIDIFDMNGRQVYSINRPNITQGHQLITLPVEKLGVGNYILSLKAGDVVRSEKVILE